jgi:tellurite resistance protein TehA-like permease
MWKGTAQMARVSHHIKMRVVASLALRRHLAGLRPSELHPIYPAMVMGTGSLSTGALLLGMRPLSVALCVISAGAFALLCALALLRILGHRDRLREDAGNPRTAFAPYTFVAALAVLGTRFALDGHTVFPAAALVAGIAGCAALAVPGVRMLRGGVRLEGVTGNWQLPSVAIEALALLAASLGLTARSQLCEALAIALWLFGIPAYVAVIPAFVRRFRRLPTSPADLTPDYWTLMAVPSLIGLVAAKLWSAAPAFASASWLRPAYRPIALGGLAISAVLAPIWIALQIWRLVRDPASRRYSPTWWGLVFPTAIVVVAAQVVSKTFGPGWLHQAALVGYWFVLAAWATVGIGLVRDLPRSTVADFDAGLTK